ncbi:MAG: hypothetical protein IPH42_13905 [Bacteroidetes bacterium]|nr:hypothetical protein [Bacteroidota bacterium]
METYITSDWIKTNWKEIKEQFDLKVTYLDRVKFWTEKRLHECSLNALYSNGKLYVEPEEIENFEKISITPINETERTQINFFLYENHDELYPKKVKCNFNALKKRFEEKLPNALSPEKLIADEITAIEKTIEMEKNRQDNMKTFTIGFRAAENGTYLDLFKNKYIHGQGVFSTYIIPENIFVGIHAAHYYFYLKGLLNSENKNPKVKTKTLTAKQQILLLHHLGVFNLPTIESMSQKKKGILFGVLLGSDNSNMTDYITYTNPTPPKSQMKHSDNAYNTENIKEVNKLLKSVDLPLIEIKV